MTQNPSIADAEHHHAFHQTADLPEALIAGREHIYFTWFYRNWGASPQRAA